MEMDCRRGGGGVVGNPEEEGVGLWEIQKRRGWSCGISRRGGVGLWEIQKRRGRVELWETQNGQVPKGSPFCVLCGFT